MASRTPEIVGAVRSRWRWLQRLHPWRTFSHFTDVGGGVLSAGMSYQAMFAVFAALWIGFGVFGIVLFSHPELLDTLIDQVNLFVPGLIGEGNDALVTKGALREASTAINVTSAVAGVSLLWVAVAWFTGTRRAIRIIFGLDVKQYRNAALLKLRDLALAIFFLVAMLISAALTVVSSSLTETVIGWLGADPGNWLVSGLGVTARYAAMFVFDVLILLAIHVWLAEVRAPRWPMLVGCMLGGAVLFGLKVLGATLLGGATSNPLFASFVLFVGLLIWFNLVCRTLLLTASWIATGQNRSLGLPADLVVKRAGSYEV